MYEPDPSPEADILAFINEAPFCHFRLTAAAERLLADLGVEAPARSVLRDLFFDGEQTAPDIARKRPVTRQAVQPVLDNLIARGFVSTKPNPRHKRSKLYLLTPAGIELCVEIQRRELAAIRDRLARAGDADFAAATKAIRTLNNVLKDYLDETA